MPFVLAFSRPPARSGCRVPPRTGTKKKSKIDKFVKAKLTLLKKGAVNIDAPPGRFRTLPGGSGRCRDAPDVVGTFIDPREVPGRLRRFPGFLIWFKHNTNSSNISRSSHANTAVLKHKFVCLGWFRVHVNTVCAVAPLPQGIHYWGLRSSN